MDEEATFHALDAMHCTATLRNQFVTIWRAAPEVERVRRFDGPIARLAGRGDGRFGFWVLMDTPLLMPSAEAYQAATPIFRRFGAQFAFQVAVYAAAGPFASLLRMTLGTIAVTALRHPINLTRTVEEAARWAAAKPGVGLTAEELVALVGKVRAAYDARLGSSVPAA